MLEDALRETLKYVPQFRDKIIIININCDFFDDHKLSNLTKDLGVLMSLNIKTVIVFDYFPNYKSINSPISSDLMEKISISSINKSNKILTALTDLNLIGIIGNFVMANPIGIKNGKNMELLGKVNKINTDQILENLKNNIVIFPPLGFSKSNKILYLESFELSIKLAESLNAIKIISLENNVKEFWKDVFKIRQITTKEAEKILSNKKINIKTKHKLKLAIDACKNGVDRIQLLDHSKSNFILTELFSNKGVGYMLHADEYELIRKAKIDDINEIYNLVQYVNTDKELIHRNTEQISTYINDYFVIEIDQNIIGCVAFHSYNHINNESKENKIAELACLCVHPNYTNNGYGIKLVNFLEKKAKQEKYNYIFSLTTRAENFFSQKVKFTEAKNDILPKKRLKSAQNSKRNSKIMVKYL